MPAENSSGNAVAGGSYAINDLIVDVGQRRVFRNKTELSLSKLSFDCLRVLIEAAPDAVSHETLTKAVWGSRRVITPENLAKRMLLLRRALGDSVEQPRYIEGVRGHGYRLHATVKQVDPDSSPPPRQFALPAAFATVVTVLIAFTFAGFLRSANEITPTVAVLPFADLSEQGNQAYLADGIAEELILTLSELDGLGVASRTSSFAVRDLSHDAQSIGDELGVTAILEGSIRKADDDIRITVQLIDVETGLQLWSENFTGESGDIFATQDKIAAAVAGALGVRLGVGGVNEFVGAGTENFAAYEAYLRGEYTEAIRLDPNYAAAWAREGIMIASTMWENPPEQAEAIIENAYKHVARAIEIDPQSSRAYGEYATLSYARADWETAQQNFDEALRRRRDSRNLRHYSNLLARAGRTSEAALIRQEMEQQLPTIGNAPSVANIDIALGNHSVAREHNRLMIDPLRKQQILMVIAIHERSIDDLRAAVRELSRTNAVYAEAYGPLIAILDSPESALRYLKALFNDTDIIWADKYHDIALLAAHFGDPQFAMEVFSREIYHTTIRFFAFWYPVMSDVRKLPEFRQFVRDANLVDYWRNHGWADYCHPTSLEEFICE